MNSKWQIHRVGLIDFWYYDEEEFYFIDGRMLLRGSNGSGKSVTMQSFIPLLLDGNLRPERLDPFGSKARKMENYLLEEEDEREERTGYLYMELKRVDSDTYVSLGMGLRARKGKKLESWFFAITDGRRIGKDIYLYKDVDNKIVYTKTELRNRIGEGGKVMETQGEYAQCVNRLLFGFETMEEYREMLDLLIQLRTPKLSKDFKPSIINDILSNSLQTLTEDDLRPMSEAVENMDSLKTNLDTLKESVQAAKAIRRAYDQYNQIMLYDKAQMYTKELEAYAVSLKKAKELENRLTQTKESIRKQQENYESLSQEEEVLKEEKRSLDDSDAVSLKEQELRLLEEITNLNQTIAVKEKQEQEKKEKQIEVEGKLSRRNEENESLWEEIEGDLEEMEGVLSDVSFDEFSFLQKELLEHPGEAYPFRAHTNELKEYVKKVDEGIRLLEQERVCRDKYDRSLQELEELQKDQEQGERELQSYENQLHEIKEELTENIYRWERDNSQLKADAEVLREIARQVQEYRFGTDFGEAKEKIRPFLHTKENEIQKCKRELADKTERMQEEFDQVTVQLKEWEGQKDPEPPKTEQVEQNRLLLKNKGIPFVQFYKAIDFASGLTPAQASHLEEALFEMGILDALLVPEEYRKQVCSLDPGVCDRYIFSDVSHVKGNLLEVLEVDNGDNDILLYQKISNVLSAVGYAVQGQKQGEAGHTWIDGNGHYRTGVIEGTITKNYEAKYIGIRAREKYRMQQLTALTLQRQALEKELHKLWKELELLLEKEEKLQQEWIAFPAESDLKVAAEACAQKEYFLSNLRLSIGRQKQRMEEERKAVEKLQVDVQNACAKTYLPVRLDVFKNARIQLQEYADYLAQLEICHEKYLQGLQYVNALEEQQDGLWKDLDDIRYDLGKAMSALRESQLAKESVTKQLGLTNYEQIKERLDYCIGRLRQLPGEREESVRILTKLEDECGSLEQLKQDNQMEQVRADYRSRKGKKIFETEYALGYVAKTFVITEDTEDQAKKVCAMLTAAFGNKRAADMAGSLQEAYHANRGQLLEYHMTMQTMFTELEEEVDLPEANIRRITIMAKYRGMTLPFLELLYKLAGDVEEQERLLSDKDRELFEDILANTISKKIRGKIQSSKRWVDKMNELMESMQTSSGLSLSLRWRNKRAEKEEQLDTRLLVDLLQKDVEIMKEEEVELIARHFRSKIEEARKRMDDSGTVQSFHGVMREVLDYRKWFEFQLESQKTGEKRKELTDRVFFTFSGGEKAMAMYVPLFSAVVAKYAGARSDAPRMISLDEAFAGVDEMNIQDMFRLMVEFEFNFMLNSQILWGDCETVPSLAIYQLIRPENVKFVTVIPHVWEGNVKRRVERIGDEIIE